MDRFSIEAKIINDSDEEEYPGEPEEIIVKRSGPGDNFGNAIGWVIRQMQFDLVNPLETVANIVWTVLDDEEFSTGEEEMELSVRLLRGANDIISYFNKMKK